MYASVCVSVCANICGFRLIDQTNSDYVKCETDFETTFNCEFFIALLFIKTQGGLILDKIMSGMSTFY